MVPSAQSPRGDGSQPLSRGGLDKRHCRGFVGAEKFDISMDTRSIAKLGEMNVISPLAVLGSYVWTAAKVLTVVGLAVWAIRHSNPAFFSWLCGCNQ